MAVWLPSNGKLYLPPQKPTPRVLSTDEYVTRTNVYFHATSERLFTVGHPYFPVLNGQNEVEVPMVSANQYRVWRLLLPDPNKFALVDKSLYDPDSERLVWAVRGLEVTRGGPLGVGVCGHPLFNKYADAENPFTYNDAPKDENRLNVATEPKQTQLFILGCVPAVGGHWDAAKPCGTPAKGSCPPLEYVNSPIEDGNMCDTGFGNLNFRNLSADKASVPLDIVNDVCKWPDFTHMTKDTYGDSLFFYGNREQLYCRHMANRAGKGDAIPEHNEYYLPPKNDTAQYTNFASHTYFATVSGSLVSSEAQLFNKPYWLQRAQGPNNGICWGNQLFLTLVDNTRNINYTISVYNGDSATFPADYNEYKEGDFKQYLRHTEEYNIECIFQLCKVSLTADILAHLNVMNPQILEQWQLAFMPPPPTGIESTYRYIQSLATKCPPADSEQKDTDPYKDLNFWVVDLTDKFTSELSQVSLGRRFLYQMGFSNVSQRAAKRSATVSTKRSKKTIKKRRLNA